jgi:CheY-like chemotaxis protein
MLAFLATASPSTVFCMGAKTILVVDSNPGVLVVAKKVLGRAGYGVLSAATVEEGVARANRYSPDLVILDGLLSTPGALLELVWSSSRRMPIILMSPRGQEGELLDAVGANRWHAHAEVVAILEKPLSGDALVQAARRALTRTPPPSRYRNVVIATLIDPEFSQSAPRSISSEDTVLSSDEVTPEDLLDEPLLPSVLFPIPSAVPEGAVVADIHALDTRSVDAREYRAEIERREAISRGLEVDRRPTGTFAALLEESQRPILSIRTPPPLADSPWHDEPIDVEQIAMLRADLRREEEVHRTASHVDESPTDMTPMAHHAIARIEATRIDLVPPDTIRFAAPIPLERERPARSESASSLFAALADAFDRSESAESDLNSNETIVSVAAEQVSYVPTSISSITDPPCDPAPEIGGEVVLRGRLGTIRVEQVLQLAADTSNGACLRLEHDRSTLDLFFEDGAIAFARRHQPADWDAIDLWIDERLFDPPDGGRVSTVAREIELAIFEAVRWREGRFSIIENEPIPEAAQLERVRLPLVPLILEGVRRLDEWRRMSRELTSPSAIPGRLSRADEARVVSSLSAEQRRVLEVVDGRKSIEEVVRTVQRPPIDVIKALHRLRDERLVTLVEKIGSA